MSQAMKSQRWVRPDIPQVKLRDFRVMISPIKPFDHGKPAQDLPRSTLIIKLNDPPVWIRPSVDIETIIHTEYANLPLEYATPLLKSRNSLTNNSKISTAIDSNLTEQATDLAGRNSSASFADCLSRPPSIVTTNTPPSQSHNGDYSQENLYSEEISRALEIQRLLHIPESKIYGPDARVHSDAQNYINSSVYSMNLDEELDFNSLIELEDDYLWLAMKILPVPRFPHPTCWICNQAIKKSLNWKEQYAWYFLRCRHQVHVSCFRDLTWMNNPFHKGCRDCSRLHELCRSTGEANVAARIERAQNMVLPWKKHWPAPSIQSIQKNISAASPKKI
ncbi:hypothetical protein BS50DRAFT_593506 [Corynespora cassiicola Philippines]|uniref:Uncharacterized protein n=1 Tax=Corynespora cassiicola Philippines TaxID=1448308 RepID=A0A2T2N5W4_CORCC|nr:hypothetical protein BS50DRAFT_593506 [Corynespora cassiicola Philippines]